MEDNLEDCCWEPNLCYQHLVMSGIPYQEALKIIKDREKLEKELIPKIKPNKLSKT